MVGCWGRAGPEESQGPEAKLKGVLREQWVNPTPSQLEQRFGVNYKIEESISEAVTRRRKLRRDQISRRLRAAPEGSYEQGGVGVCEGVGCLPKAGLTGRNISPSPAEVYPPPQLIPGWHHLLLSETVGRPESCCLP